MAYSTNTSIVAILPGLPQTSSSKGFSSTVSVVDSHILRADNIINAKVGRRYDFSVFDTTGSVPPLLKTLSEDIATHYTYRSEFSADNQNDNEWTDKFKDALLILDEVKDGDMDLFDPSGTPIDERTAASSTALVESSTQKYTPMFDEGEPINWEVDPDKKSDIASSRS